MKALYGGPYLLCNFLLYATHVSDVSWAAHKLEKIANTWLVTNEHCEEEIGVSHWNHIILIAQDNSETKHLSFCPDALKGIL